MKERPSQHQKPTQDKPGQASFRMEKKERYIKLNSIN